MNSRLKGKAFVEWLVAEGVSERFYIYINRDIRQQVANNRWWKTLTVSRPPFGSIYT